MKSKIKLSDIFAYIQGKLREKVYYKSYWRYFIPVHIYEQITYRLQVMDKECYTSGACKICGCETVALQMADKACPKPCYPAMKKSADWKSFKKRNGIEFTWTDKTFELRITKEIWRR